MRKFTFEKEESNRWFVILPEWDADKESLEMVLGADTFLDEISNYGDRVTLLIDTEKQDGWQTLDKIMFDESTQGAYYSTDGSLKVQTIWLCEVLEYIYNEYPQTLYYQKTKTE